MKKYIVAAGDAFSGMHLYGPFESGSDAAEWASEDDNLRGNNWEIVSVERPSSLGDPPAPEHPLRKAMIDLLSVAELNQDDIEGETYDVIERAYMALGIPVNLDPKQKKKNVQRLDILNLECKVEKVVTPQDVYEDEAGEINLDLPEGYEFTGEFRIPLDEELFLGTSVNKDGEHFVEAQVGWGIVSRPRLILRERPSRKEKRK
jgi:hypothetical protein